MRLQRRRREAASSPFRGFKSCHSARKTVNFDTKLTVFSTKSVFADGINQSSIDEICFPDEIACGGSKTDLISSKPQGFDFIQTCLDFIVSETNDFIEQNFFIYINTLYTKEPAYAGSFHFSPLLNCA